MFCIKVTNFLAGLESTFEMSLSIISEFHSLFIVYMKTTDLVCKLCKGDSVRNYASYSLVGARDRV